MATCRGRRRVILFAVLMLEAAVVCSGNMMDELESGYFDREYSLTKPYAGEWPAHSWCTLGSGPLRITGGSLSPCRPELGYGWHDVGHPGLRAAHTGPPEHSRRHLEQSG